MNVKSPVRSPANHFSKSRERPKIPFHGSSQLTQITSTGLEKPTQTGYSAKAFPKHAHM